MELNRPIDVEKGERFAIVISLEHPEDSEKYEIAVEASFSNIGNRKSGTVSIEEGQSFCWTQNGWVDFIEIAEEEGTDEISFGNLCLKALTVDRSSNSGDSDHSSSSGESSGSQGFGSLQQISDPTGQPVSSTEYFYQGELKGGAAVDTQSYTMPLGGTYTVLLKNPVPGVTYTAYSENPSVFTLLQTGTDARGNLYTLQGESFGTAYFVLQGSDGSLVKIPITISANTLLLDTDSCSVAAGGIYQVLIENPTPGASYRLLSGNGDVVGLEAMQENYISRSGKSGVLCTCLLYTSRCV